MSDPLKPLFSSLPSGIAKLAEQAAAARSMTDLVRGALPEALRSHVVSASRRGDDLTVTVDSAAWSARVRYAGPKLKERLQSAGQPGVQKIRVRVRGRAGTPGVR